MRGVREINKEIDSLTSIIGIAFTPRVMTLIKQIQEENKPRVEALRQELKQVEKNKKAPKARWPDNTPKAVLDLAFQEFRGSTEFEKFRIHCWNDKAFWVSWPSGGYSVVGGWVPTPATFTMLSLNEKSQYNDKQPKKIKALEGRVSMKTMQMELDKLNVPHVDNPLTEYKF